MRFAGRGYSAAFFPVIVFRVRRSSKESDAELSYRNRSLLILNRESSLSAVLSAVGKEVDSQYDARGRSPRSRQSSTYSPTTGFDRFAGSPVGSTVPE